MRSCAIGRPGSLASPGLASFVLLASLALGACGGGARQGRPIGSSCGGEDECVSGASCIEGRCLDPEADEDHDGVINRVENDIGTSVFDPDTDGDGISDKDELTSNLASVDTDGDGKPDAIESNTADADNDCIPDQLDAQDDVANGDLSPLISVLCSKKGVCGAPGARLAVTCASGSADSAACDYAGVTGYEAVEASCDALDNDCDGKTDEDLPAGACDPDLIALVVNPSPLALEVGETRALVATGTWDDQTSADVSADATWTTSAAGVATVSEVGVVTAVGPGEADVTATLDGFSATSRVTVTAAPIELVRITITPTDPSTPLGIPVTFTARGHYDDESEATLTAGVTWASSVSAIATIEATGIASPKQTGETTITAKVGSVTGSTRLTVTAAVITSVTLTPDPANVALGNTLALVATATMSSGAPAVVTDLLTWSSDTPSVATVAGGIVTTHAQGTATITASHGTSSWTIAVTVGPPVPASIVVSPATPSIAAGASVRLYATATLTNDDESDVSATATWTSLQPSVATVDATGLVAGKAVGSATVRAQLGSLTADATVTVTAATITSLVLTPDPATVALGQTLSLVATATLSTGGSAIVTQSLSWSTSEPSVATVVAGVVSTHAVGTARITATDGSSSWWIDVVVGPKALVSVTIEPDAVTIAKGTTYSFVARARYTDQSSEIVTAQATWRSLASAIVTMVGPVATGVAVGATGIEAELGGKKGAAVVTVGPAAAISLSIAPASPRVAVEGTLQLHAIGAMTDGSEPDLSTQVTWSSDDDTVATIGAQGLVTGVTVGSVDVTAKLGEVEAVTTVVVFVPVPLPLVVSRPVLAVAQADRGIFDRSISASAPPVRTVIIDSAAPAASGGALNALSVVVSDPPIRTIVIDSTRRGGGTGDITGLGTVVAGPPVRVVIIESSSPSGGTGGGGSGINTLTTIVSNPPIRTLVVNSTTGFQGGVNSPSVVVGRPPVKVDWGNP